MMMTHREWLEAAIDQVRTLADRLSIVVVSRSQANTGTVYLRCRTAHGVGFALRLSDHPMPAERRNPFVWSAMSGRAKSLSRLRHFMHTMSKGKHDAAGVD